MKHTKLRIAIVGASGFIGRAIARAAANAGHSVTEVNAPRLRMAETDVADPTSLIPQTVLDQLVTQFIGHGAVVNAAGISDAASNSVSELYGANALLPVAIAKAARLAQVPRFVHISSAAVQGSTTLDETPRVQPFSPYSRSKALAERWLTDSFLDNTVILRPTSVHGPERRVTRAVAKLAASPFSSFAEDSPTQQTRVETVAHAALVAATRTPSLPPILLTPDEGLSTRTYLELVGGRAPKKIPPALAHVAIRLLTALGRINPRLAANARRLEVLWFGQRRRRSWLDRQQIVKNADSDFERDNWRTLGERARRRERPRVLFGVTTGVSVRGFFEGQFTYLRSQGWDVYLTCADEGNPGSFAAEEGALYLPTHAKREPSPLSDLGTLIRLWITLRRVRPDIAVWGSPKVGLLGSLASWANRTPAMYVVHGLRLETTSGWRRRLLAICERIAVKATTATVAVGNELKAAIIAEGIATNDSVVVLNNGSANGIRVRPIPDHLQHHEEKRFGFVGRLTVEKGIRELADAWRIVRAQREDVRLDIFGTAETDDASRAVLQQLEAMPGVHLHGHVKNLEDAYRNMYALLLPSYREGLPNVVLEANSIGVPAVVTRATGASESVVDTVTGIVIPVKDSQSLANAMLKLARDTSLRDRMGLAAYHHVISLYKQEELWLAWDRQLRAVAEL